MIAIGKLKKKEKKMNNFVKRTPPKGPKKPSFEEMLRKDPSLAKLVKRCPSSTTMVASAKFGRLPVRTEQPEELHAELSDDELRRPREPDPEDKEDKRVVEIDMVGEDEE